MKKHIVFLEQEGIVLNEGAEDCIFRDNAGNSMLFRGQA